MYKRYSFDLRPFLLSEGDNVLLIIFTGPAKELERIKSEYELKFGIPVTKYMRKAQNDFNDYLGIRPNFMKVGIFRDVLLDVPGQTWLDNIFIRPLLSEDLSEANVVVDWEAKGPNALVRYSLIDKNNKIVKQGEANTEHLKLSFKIDQPNLWWPYTHGEPYLYKLKFEVMEASECIDTQTFNVGIRRIVKVDMDENTGEARFAFKINNKQIYLMGAGWAPLEGMTHVWDKERSDRARKGGEY